MIKVNELRKSLSKYIGHDNFTVNKYTLKHDNKKGYSIVVHGHGEENKKLPVYSTFEGLKVHLLSDKADNHWFSGKSLGFRAYELLP